MKCERSGTRLMATSLGWNCMPLRPGKLGCAFVAAVVFQFLLIQSMKAEDSVEETARSLVLVLNQAASWVASWETRTGSRRLRHTRDLLLPKILNSVAQRALACPEWLQVSNSKAIGRVLRHRTSVF